MTDIERRLGFDFDDKHLRSTACHLLHEQLVKLEDTAFDDPPPGNLLTSFSGNPSKKSVSPEDVQRLSANLYRHWEERPLPKLLVTAYEAKDIAPEGYSDIVAKTAHLSLLLADMSETYAEEIVQACRRARLLTSSDAALPAHLPSFRQSFGDIADAIAELAESPPEKLLGDSSNLKRWLLAFTTYLDGRQKYSRHAFGSSLTLEAEVVEHALADDPDTTLAVSEEEINVPFPNSPEEARHDQPKAGKAVRVLVRSTSSDQSRGVAYNQGREIRNRLFMDHASPISLDSRLTPHQIRCAFEQSYRRAQKSPADLLVSLSILTGRRIERLMSFRMRKRKQSAGPGEYWLVESGRVYLWYEPTLPEHAKVTSLKGVKRAKDNGICIALPRRLGNALIKLYRGKSNPIGPIDASPAIGEIAAAVDKNVTAVRISHASRHMLTSQGIDEVTIAWLCGEAPEHHAGMYYTLVDRHEATSVYAAFVNALLERNGVKERIPAVVEHSFVGTRVRINPKFIARSFAHQRKELKAALRNSSATCMYAFHNRLTLYVIQLLGMATLIRSVTEPFGRRDDTNILANTIRIADKANRAGANGRLIALGNTAVEQISAYTAHVQELYHELRHEQPETAAAIQKSIDGTGSFLFRFDKDRQVESMRPKLILQDLRGLWPFPTNWARHSMSAWIRKHAFSKGAVRALFGHSDFGAAPLSRFDGTSVFELTHIANVIDDYFTKHKIRSIDGWNTRT